MKPMMTSVALDRNDPSNKGFHLSGESERTAVSLYCLQLVVSTSDLTLQPAHPLHRPCFRLIIYFIKWHNFERRITTLVSQNVKMGQGMTSTSVWIMKLSLSNHSIQK